MTDFSDAKAKADELRRKLAQLDRLTGRSDERQRDADRKRASRAAGRVVIVPPCADPKRRKRLERNVFKWLRWYFADIFDRDFTDQAKEMILALVRALETGDDQSIAASRGEGKTTDAECVLIYCACRELIRYAILFAATGGLARDSMAAIKERLENNDRLADDYPEVCIPIRALEGIAQRAPRQLVSGQRHDTGEPFATARSTFTWRKDVITLPAVPGSPASGAIIQTRGLDAAVRGAKVGGKAQRPDLAVIDDPDTAVTASNPDLAKKLEWKIDTGIAQLSGQKRRVARVMLTTVQRRGSVSDRFTDRKVKPSWKPKRFRFLVEKPTREDLWQEYVELRRQDWLNEAEDRPTTLADNLYGKNFAAMNAGAVVANPWRKPGGERTALQWYFNEVARTSAEAVAQELDNDPPEEAGPVESGITASRVQRQLSGFDRQRVPPGCTLIVQGGDLNKRALHWVVRAFRPDGLGIYTIDYGVHELLGTKYGSDEGLDLAVRRAILSRMEATRATEYLLPDGEVLTCSLTVIDAGWQTEAVYAACAEAGVGVMPIMGFGQSSGCASANFSHVQKASRDRRPGDGWFLSRRGSIWLVCSDADRWKRWEHDRWMTAPGKPGCMYLFGQPGEPGGRLSHDERGHTGYAHHICNEVEIEEPYKGTVRRRWKAKSDNVHYLDASAYCDVGANIRGFRLGPSTAKPTPHIPGQLAGDAPKSGGWFSSQSKR